MRPLRIVTIVGARPQFIKAAPLSQVLAQRGHHEWLVHTGQHYDYGMSQVFFEEMGLSEPYANLGVGSGSHGYQTAQMLLHIEELLLKLQAAGEKLDAVIVFGDTNSTLAGALAACKLGIPLAHVEAGLRSFNRAMPEEHNRVLTDHCADLLFCPTHTAVENLAREGITQGVHLVGDPMFDAVLQFADRARKQSQILAALNLTPQRYLLATVHRAYNTDEQQNLRNILEALAQVGEPVIFPAHPRTRKAIEQLGGNWLTGEGGLRIIEPVSYLEMLALEQNARLILTDSGGMQKEAFFFQVPCVTLRPETEWVETVALGWNEVVGTDPERILWAVHHKCWPAPSASDHQPFGDGSACQRMVKVLEQRSSQG